MNAKQDNPSLAVVRRQIKALRSCFGSRDWLTVVGGVTAAAYRLAGFSGEEFAALLRSDTAQRGRLLIHLRRKANMRLRAGFDGRSGGISEKDGFAHLHLHFGGGHYTDAGTDCELQLSGKLRTSLAVVGGLNRSVDRVGLGGLPRCLTIAGGRVTTIEQRRWSSGGGTTIMRLDRSYEKLAAMPDDIADGLGLERQRHLGHIPWLGVDAPVASGTTVTVVPPTRLRRRRAELRLVTA